MNAMDKTIKFLGQNKVAQKNKSKQLKILLMFCHFPIIF